MMEVENILLFEVASILLVVLAALTVCLFYIDKNRKLRRGQELLKTQIEIQEHSFDKIYREIHDNIGQELSLAKLNLSTIQHTLSSNTLEKITHTKDLVGKAILDLRNLTKSIIPAPILKMGLNEAIRKELFVVAKTSKADFNFNQIGTDFRFDHQKELIVFSMFQDIINRATYNPNISRIEVVLKYEKSYLNLIIIEDIKCVGNEKNDTQENDPEFSIQNIYTRAMLLQADVNITSNTGKEIISLKLSL